MAKKASPSRPRVSPRFFGADSDDEGVDQPVTSRDPKRNGKNEQQKQVVWVRVAGLYNRVLWAVVFFVFVIIGDNILSFMVIDLVLYIFLMIQSSYKVYFY